MHFLSHIGRIPAGGLPETNSNWLVSVLLFWVRKSREKSSCPYFNLFSLLHKAGYFLAGVALGVGSSIFNEDAFRFGEFRLQHWGLGDWWCNGEFSCLIVLDSGNPAETWWHLMNWCDFWVKNSLQIQMILPPRPGVPVFFFQEDYGTSGGNTHHPSCYRSWGLLDRLCRTWPHGWRSHWMGLRRWWTPIVYYSLLRIGV